MTTRENLIQRIEAHLKATGKSPTALCKEAGADHHIISKLKNGESISLKSIERIEFVLSMCQLTSEIG